ncbi:hypothetical protein AAVH_28180 [Aphelenchoides avenae]|nr:hypothetical protein AAVH_28180 [Aphelenchus avenae]
MAKGDELPISTEQHKRAFVAEAMDERKSRATDARTPAKATNNGSSSHGGTACRRQNAIRRRRPVSVDSVVVEVCTTTLSSPQASRLAPSTEGTFPCYKLVKDAGLNELPPPSKFHRAAKAAHHAGHAIHLMKKARQINPFEGVRTSRSDSELDLLMADCCLDEECDHQ